jgi:methionyl-tRNA formyltransferase
MKKEVNAKEIKILWLGTPLISAIVLEKLIKENYNIVGVVAQIDKPVGRKMKLEPVPTKVIANKYNIPVYQPVKIRNEFDFIKKIKPDLIITLAYGQIIPHDMLTIPVYGCLNLHGSLLPKYRGAAPMQYALLNGDKVTGITLMEMVDKMDAGKMYYKKTVEIKDDDNLDSLTLKMADCAYETLITGLPDYLNGINNGEEQNESQVTFTTKIKPEDQIISFDETAENIHNKIRALNSEPGCYFTYKNMNYKVGSSKLVDNKCKSGEIYKYDKSGLYIGASDKILVITSIQKPGKKMMSISDFYNGNRELFIKGDIIK